METPEPSLKLESHRSPIERWTLIVGYEEVVDEDWSFNPIWSWGQKGRRVTKNGAS